MLKKPSVGVGQMDYLGMRSGQTEALVTTIVLHMFYNFRAPILPTRTRASRY